MKVANLENAQIVDGVAVEITANTSGLKAGVAESRRIVADLRNESAVIGTKLEAGQLRADVARAIASAGMRITLPAGVDALKLRADTTRAIATAQAGVKPIVIPMIVDAAGAKAAVAAALAQLNAPGAAGGGGGFPIVNVARPQISVGGGGGMIPQGVAGGGGFPLVIANPARGQLALAGPAAEAVAPGAQNWTGGRWVNSRVVAGYQGGEAGSFATPATGAIARYIRQPNEEPPIGPRARNGAFDPEDFGRFGAGGFRSAARNTLTGPAGQANFLRIGAAIGIAHVANEGLQIASAGTGYAAAVRSGDMEKVEVARAGFRGTVENASLFGVPVGQMGKGIRDIQTNLFGGSLGDVAVLANRGLRAVLPKSLQRIAGDPQTTREEADSEKAAAEQDKLAARRAVRAQAVGDSSQRFKAVGESLNEQVAVMGKTPAQAALIQAKNEHDQLQEQFDKDRQKTQGRMPPEATEALKTSSDKVAKLQQQANAEQAAEIRVGQRNQLKIREAGYVAVLQAQGKSIAAEDTQLRAGLRDQEDALKEAIAKMQVEGADPSRIAAVQAQLQAQQASGRQQIIAQNTGRLRATGQQLDSETRVVAGAQAAARGEGAYDSERRQLRDQYEPKIKEAKESGDATLTQGLQGSLAKQLQAVDAKQKAEEGRQIIAIDADVATARLRTGKQYAAAELAQFEATAKARLDTLKREGASTDRVQAEERQQQAAREELKQRQTDERKQATIGYGTRQKIAASQEKNYEITAGTQGRIGQMQQERAAAPADQRAQVAATQKAELKAMRAELVRPTGYAVGMDVGHEIIGGPSGQSGKDLSNALKAIGDEESELGGGKTRITGGQVAGRIMSASSKVRAGFFQQNQNQLQAARGQLRAAHTPEQRQVAQQRIGDLNQERAAFQHPQMFIGLDQPSHGRGGATGFTGAGGMTQDQAEKMLALLEKIAGTNASLDQKAQGGLGE